MLGTALRAGYRAQGLAAPRTRPRRARTHRDHRDLVERTKESLAAAQGAPRPLAELARDVHSSPYRLDDGERNLGGLALDLGFAIHSHRTTQFRRTFGLTPNAFRR